MHLLRKTNGNLSKFLTVLGIIGATLAGLAIVTKLAKNHFAKKEGDTSTDEDAHLGEDFWDETPWLDDEEEEESAEVPAESEEQAEEAAPNETI